MVDLRWFILWYPTQSADNLNCMQLNLRTISTVSIITKAIYILPGKRIYSAILTDILKRRIWFIDCKKGVDFFGHLFALVHCLILPTYDMEYWGIFYLENWSLHDLMHLVCISKGHIQRMRFYRYSLSGSNILLSSLVAKSMNHSGLSWKGFDLVYHHSVLFLRACSYCRSKVNGVSSWIV
jgi:hypothetical protein